MANEIGNTEVAATIEQLISAIVQDELKEKGIVAGTIMDRSSMVGPGMDRISFPRAGSLTAEAKLENTDLNRQTLTFSNDTLTLDQHKAIYAAVEDIAGLQAKPDVVRTVIKAMASELVLDFDKFIYGKLKLASAASPDHKIAYSNASSIGQVDILEARTLLNKSFAPQDDRFLLVSPDSEKAMLQISDFIHVDKYGGGMSEGLVNGELGRVYGFKVIMSTIVNDLESVAYHKGCAAFAYQKRIGFEEDRDLKALSSEYVMSTIYGAKELQGGVHQVVLGTA